MAGFSRPDLCLASVVLLWYYSTMSRLIDLKGRRFGRLLVVERYGGFGRPKWLCICDCGNTKVCPSGYLLSGDTNSCGCLRVDTTSKLGLLSRKHGGKGTTEYKVWDGIKQRCLNPGDKAYKYYGGRGIIICDRWRSSFENFLADVGYRPSLDLTLNRIDNDGPYSPDNCKWSTWTEQNNNHSRNKILEYLGERKTLAEWSRYFRVNYKTLKWAIWRGESLEQVVNRMEL